MDRYGRLKSAGPWLATQRGRPAARIAKSYRKLYGVDWICAIAELTILGTAFDPKWREQLARTLEASRQAKARAASEREAARARRAFPACDENFAYIAGYTEGGAAYGVTWEEWEALEKNALVEPRLTGETRKPSDNEQLPF